MSVIYVYTPTTYPGEHYLGVPTRDLTQADFDALGPLQKRAITQPVGTRIYVPIGEVNETELARIAREAAAQAAREVAARALRPAYRGELDAIETGTVPIALAGIADALGAYVGPGYRRAEDYSGTDTQKVMAALADLQTNGGGILSVKGDQQYAQTIIVPANVRIANGSFWSEAVLRPAVSFTGDYLLHGSTGAAIEDVTVDLGMHGTCTYGVAITGSGTLKRSAIRRCNIKNAAGRGIWVWTAQGAWVEDNEIEDCAIGVFVDRATSDGSWVLHNRVTNAEAGRMEYGILASDGVDNTTATVVIDGNYVEGADYATVNGSSAVGIALFRSPGSIVQSNDVTRCGNPANNLGAGILMGGNAEGSGVIGNHVYDNEATGIYLEYDGASVVLDADEIRAGLAQGNTVHGNAVAGISCSYAAGAGIDNNTVYNNGSDGIVCDSDYVGITNNTVFSNWQDASFSAPSQNGGRKAGIRSHGSYNVITGNRVYDNQTVKTQTIGMAVEHRGCIVQNNQLRASSDPLYENGAVLANTTGNNVEVTA